MLSACISVEIIRTIQEKFTSNGKSIVNAVVWMYPPKFMCWKLDPNSGLLGGGA